MMTLWIEAPETLSGKPFYKTAQTLAKISKHFSQEQKMINIMTNMTFLKS